MKKLFKRFQIPNLGYLGLLGLIALITYCSFAPRKCVHEFVRSEDSVIKIQKYQFDGQDGYYPVGRKNGPMLICLKCLYKTPQVYDYGDANKNISGQKTNGKNNH